MIRKSVFSTAVIIVLFYASAAMAQYLTVGADQVKDLMAGGKKALLIDVRSLEEYQAGHIPGAVNIPADRVAAEKNRLPRDKATPLIFYCRGVG